MSHDYPFDRRDALLALCLTVLLLGIYWLTYSGRILSTDEASLFDGVEGFVRRGNTQVALTLDYPNVRDFSVGDQPTTPLVDAEPMQIMAGALLFSLGQALPGVGLMHTVWLLNVLVCAASGGVLFAYARVLGYGRKTAIVATLAYGLGTMIWPYSKLFFREPLAVLLLFGASLCLYLGRVQWGRRAAWGWLGGFLVLYLMALLTKEAAMLSLPIFLAQVFPRIGSPGGRKRLLIVLLVAAVLAVAALIGLNAVLEVIQVPRSYNPLARLADVADKGEFIGYALLGYLFSPGRSLWVFSPVLLLGLGGVGLLARQGRWRDALVPVVALLAFVVGYAVVRNELWYGGLGWGPRYLLPVIPFLMLAVLPVIERLLEGGLRGAARWAIILLLAASVGVQLLGVLVRQDVHPAELAKAGVIPGLGGTWQVAYSPVVLLPGVLGNYPLDFAWSRVGGAAGWLPLSALVLIAAASAGLVYWSRTEQTSPRLALRSGAGLIVLAAAVLWLGLRAIYPDPACLGDQAKLHDLLGLIDAQVQAGDILVLSNPGYREFFMNYYRGSNLVYTLPMAPGEQPSPEQPPEVVSTNLDLLVRPDVTVFLMNLPEYTDRVWLVESSGPFTGYTVRPVEWFLARHYFPVTTAQTDESARLILFDVNSDAPPGQAMAWPEQAVDAIFGGEVRLVGYDILAARVRVGPFAGPDPLKETYAAGDVLPLSLLWRAARAPATDYNVGVFLVNQSGVILERHGAPQAFFRPMNTWAAGDYIRDNYGLQLPDTLAPGEYELWVKVYDWHTQEALPVAGQNQIADGMAARLGTITVE
jgi:hypothetical protein